MVDYEFYKTVYLGSIVPEKAFAEAAAQAQAELQYLRRCCQVYCPGEESEKMALCAMTEAIYDCRQRRGVRSASIGGVSVSYQDVAESTAARRAARIYLDIYRGVGA